jgi:hypothetical protein
MAQSQIVTVATAADLAGLPVPAGTFISNKVLGIVSGNGTKYYLVANTGQPANGTSILDASDGRQWVQF